MELNHHPPVLGSHGSQDGSPLRLLILWGGGGLFLFPFLSNGQRVASNTPVRLPPKSSFYLGEADNTVYVDLERSSS